MSAYILVLNDFSSVRQSLFSLHTLVFSQIKKKQPKIQEQFVIQSQRLKK